MSQEPGHSGWPGGGLFRGACRQSFIHSLTRSFIAGMCREAAPCSVRAALVCAVGVGGQGRSCRALCADSTRVIRRARGSSGRGPPGQGWDRTCWGTQLGGRETGRESGLFSGWKVRGESGVPVWLPFG